MTENRSNINCNCLQTQLTSLHGNAELCQGQVMAFCERILLGMPSFRGGGTGSGMGGGGGKVQLKFCRQRDLEHLCNLILASIVQ